MQNTNEQPKTYKDEQREREARKRMGLRIPHKVPGTKFCFSDKKVGYVVTDTGTVGKLTGRSPWRNKAERKQVLRMRRADREQAAENMKGLEAR
jgi:hypothetical protein